MAPLQLLEFELSPLGHGHALQVGHQLIHRGLELLDVHGLHFLGNKFGELARLRTTRGEIYSHVRGERKELREWQRLREEYGRTRSDVDTNISNIFNDTTMHKPNILRFKWSSLTRAIWSAI